MKLATQARDQLKNLTLAMYTVGTANPIIEVFSQKGDTRVNPEQEQGNVYANAMRHVT